MSKAELFQSLGGEFFDEMRSGQQTRNIVGVVYYWQPIDEEPLTQQLLTPTPLVVCDNYWSHYDANARCLQMHSVFRKPLVLPQQFERFEEVFAEGRTTNWALLRKGGFDSVVYTPHEYSRGVRTALLLDPPKQVLNIDGFYDYDEDEVLAKRKALAPKWREITGDPGGPYTTQELQHWEHLLMAHRYAYYVEADPIITDSEYDRLDKAVTPWLPEDSPLQKPGSSLEESYRPKDKAALAQLKLGKWLHTPPTPGTYRNL